MALNLLRDLIKIPSPSGEEKELGDYIVKRLKKNFKVKIQKVNKSFNILALNGKPKLLLTTHLDTVLGILKIRENKSSIYGRGSCDAKASIAAMIVAAEKAKKLNYKNFALLFDVDEENTFSGIKKAIKLVKPKKVIIGEPTNLKLVTGQKGLLGFKIIAKGKAAPGSTPEKGKNAIELLIKEINKLQKIKFPKGTTINLGTIKGGTSSNIVPDYAECFVELRTVKENTLDLIKNKLRIKLIYNYKPIIKGNNIIPYFTEMYFWKNAFVIGPGDQKYSHSDKERVRKTEVEKAVQIYLNLIKNFLNKETRGTSKWK